MHLEYSHFDFYWIFYNFSHSLFHQHFSIALTSFSIIFILVLLFIITMGNLTVDAYSIKYILHILNIYLLFHLEVLDITIRVYCFLWIIIFFPFLPFNNSNFNLYCNVTGKGGNIGLAQRADPQACQKNRGRARILKLLARRSLACKSP